MPTASSNIASPDGISTQLAHGLINTVQPPAIISPISLNRLLQQITFNQTTQRLTQVKTQKGETRHSGNGGLGHKNSLLVAHAKHLPTVARAYTCHPWRKPHSSLYLFLEIFLFFRYTLFFSIFEFLRIDLLFFLLQPLMLLSVLNPSHSLTTCNNGIPLVNGSHKTTKRSARWHHLESSAIFLR